MRWLIAVLVFSAMIEIGAPWHSLGAQPVSTSEQKPLIVRSPLPYQAYVFFGNGMESIVIDPARGSGKQRSTLLIPVPTVPKFFSIDKRLFNHLDAAIDPPVVCINLWPQFDPRNREASREEKRSFKYEDVSLNGCIQAIDADRISEFGVSLIKPQSLDELKSKACCSQLSAGETSDCKSYIEKGWAFVAVSKREQHLSALEATKNALPSDADIARNETDGYAIGFRFLASELVLPHQVAEPGFENNMTVYLLAEQKEVRSSLPEEYVVKGIGGADVLRHLAQPLPLRIHGSTEKDLATHQRTLLDNERKPYLRNGLAAALIANDLSAARFLHLDNFQIDFFRHSPRQLQFQIGELETMILVKLDGNLENRP